MLDCRRDTRYKISGLAWRAIQLKLPTALLSSFSSPLVAGSPGFLCLAISMEVVFLALSSTSRNTSCPDASDCSPQDLSFFSANLKPGQEALYNCMPCFGASPEEFIHKTSRVTKNTHGKGEGPGRRESRRESEGEQAHCTEGPATASQAGPAGQPLTKTALRHWQSATSVNIHRSQGESARKTTNKNNSVHKVVGAQKQEA